MKLYLICPTCGSDDTMKNGTTRRGKQNYKCRDCGRQFVENPQWQPISADHKAMIDRLLLFASASSWHCPCHAGFGGLVARLRQPLL